jgi:hypothetical protein
MLVHADYTMNAHFRLLRRLIGHAEQLNFYTEQEIGIRAALLSAFGDVLDEKVEAFFVRVKKGLSVNMRRALVAEAKSQYRKWQKENRLSHVDEYEARIFRILDAIAAPEVISDKSDQDKLLWIRHPFPNLAEPEKLVHHITGADWAHPVHWGEDEYPTGDEADDGGGPLKIANSWEGYELRSRRQLSDVMLARLIDQAALHAIDLYFMQVRRDIGELERGISVASNSGRIWYGYSPYDPTMIQKLIDIHRCYFNFIQVSKQDGKTRAQRFALAKGKIRHQDIVYHR